MSKEFISEGKGGRFISNEIKFTELQDAAELKNTMIREIDFFHYKVVVNTFRSAAEQGWLTEEALTILRQAGIL